MTRTSISVLVAVAAFCAAAMAIVTWGFYGYMTRVPLSVSATLWLMAAVCIGCTLKVRAAKKKDSHGIGLDRSQLNPITIARFAMVGKASAWTGAIVGGAYAGMATFVLPKASQLVAASEDVVGVVACVLGGLAMSVSGILLERACELPPGDSGALGEGGSAGTGGSGSVGGPDSPWGRRGRAPGAATVTRQPHGGDSSAAPR